MESAPDLFKILNLDPDGGPSQARPPRSNTPKFPSSADYSAASSTTDPAELAALALHPHPKIRRAVGYNLSTPDEVRLSMLASATEHEVMAAALRHLHPQPWNVMRELMESNPALCSNRSMRFELCRMVRKASIPDPDATLLLFFTRTPNSASNPAPAWHAILDGVDWHRYITRGREPDGVDVFSREYMAGRAFPELSTRIIEEIYRRGVSNPAWPGDMWVRVNVVALPTCPDSVIIQAAADPETRVREEVVGREQLPVDAVEALAAGRSSSIHASLVAQHWDTLMRIRDEKTLSKVAARCPANSAAQPLVTHESEVVRAGLASNSALLAQQPNIAQQLVQDTEVVVRKAAAAAAPWQVASPLAHDPHHSVRVALIKHPNITADTLTLLAQDTDGRVARAAAVRLMKAFD